MGFCHYIPFATEKNTKHPQLLSEMTINSVFVLWGLFPRPFLFIYGFEKQGLVVGS